MIRLERYLLGDSSKLLGQLLEPLVTLDALANGLDLVGRDAFAEVFAFEPSLEDVVGALAAGFALSGGLEELLAQMAAAEAVDGSHFLEDLLPAVLEIRTSLSSWRCCIVSIQHYKKKRKKPLGKLNRSEICHFFVLHPLTNSDLATAHGGQVLMDALCRRFDLWKRLHEEPSLDPRKRTGAGFSTGANIAQLIFTANRREPLRQMPSG